MEALLRSTSNCNKVSCTKENSSTQTVVFGDFSEISLARSDTLLHLTMNSQHRKKEIKGPLNSLVVRLSITLTIDRNLKLALQQEAQTLYHCNGGETHSKLRKCLLSQITSAALQLAISSYLTAVSLSINCRSSAYTRMGRDRSRFLIASNEVR